ncbi:MAG: hypothetical protein V3S39_02960 [Thermodesulfobacteriota bacterium]
MALTPLKAIRRHCRWCCGSAFNVELCRDRECSLYQLNRGRRLGGLSPLKAIRGFCVGCLDGPGQIPQCRGDTANPPCPLFVYRFGKNPILKGKRGPGRPFQKGHKHAIKGRSNSPETITEAGQW